MFSDFLIGINSADAPAVAAAYDFSPYAHVANIAEPRGTSSPRSSPAIPAHAALSSISRTISPPPPNSSNHAEWPNVSPSSVCLSLPVTRWIDEPFQPPPLLAALAQQMPFS